MKIRIDHYHHFHFDDPCSRLMRERIISALERTVEDMATSKQEVLDLITQQRQTIADKTTVVDSANALMQAQNARIADLIQQINNGASLDDVKAGLQANLDAYTEQMGNLANDVAANTTA